MLKVIILLLAVISIASARLVCTPNYCDDVQCEELDCEDGQIVKEHNSSCGCCPTCYTEIQEGESCYRPPIISNSPPTSGCAEGLTCESNDICIPSCDSDE
ncbi:uncharacterized protein [Parasteatoda tepidariorum]|uniref:uncharacterized protein n=1 Tax=Parasteatoda tepidariorum TaxID=114398 RepID=UPI00077F8F38|nr:uncharacterized protein LOC107449922 [Parasteatoda tepidariorum]XP_015921087.1 uncharacterized protein LOC107449922 [Parasteatoda tepidariorum]